MTRTLYSTLSLLTLILMALGLVSCSDGIQQRDDRLLEATPDPIVFGQISFGDQGQTILTIESVGTDSVTITGVEWDGTTDITLNYEDNAPTSEAPVVLTNGDTYQVQVIYTPSDEIADNGDVVIRSNAAPPTIRVPVTTGGTGAKIQVVPDRDITLNFGSIELGNSDTRTVEIANVGSLPLLVYDIQISGSSDFEILSVTPEIPAGEDQGVELRDFSQKILVEVTYTPQTLGQDSGELLIKSNDATSPDYILPINANSGAPCIRVPQSLTPVEFSPPVRIGSEGREIVEIENCGSIDLELTGLSKSGAAEFSAEEGDPPIEGTILPPGETTSFEVVYQPLDEVADSAQFFIDSNDPINPQVTVDVFGNGTSNQCPTAEIRGAIQGSSQFETTNLAAKPLDTIVFDGTRSRDDEGLVVDFEWEVTQRPEGSTAILEPNVPGAGAARFFLQVAGNYEVCLRVYDEVNEPSCFDDCLTINSVPAEKIHIELTWDTNLTDADLHFLRLPEGSWALTSNGVLGPEDIWDTFFINPNPTWNPGEGTPEKPSLDIDDQDGFGPENINLDNPNACTFYAIGVHYYDDKGITSDTIASVRIFSNGLLAGENPYLPLTLGGETNGDFWYAAVVFWDGEEAYAWFNDGELFKQGGWKGTAPVVPESFKDELRSLPTVAGRCPLD